MKMNKKNLILLVALVVIIVALVAISSLSKKTSNTGSQTNSTTKNQNTAATGQANNASQAANGQNSAAAGTETAATLATIPSAPAGTSTPAVNQNFAPVNPTVTSQNPAVTAALSSMPGTNEAPKQEVVAADKIPAAAIKLSVSDSGFSPKEFTIKSGQEVSLAITAVGSSTHVFIFPIASLMGLQTMVSNQETKVITFTAPDAGSYGFRDDIPNFRQNTGTMIVK